jgi:hypothetical protein
MVNATSTVAHRPVSPDANGLQRCSSSFRTNDGLSVIAAERRERRRGLISRIYNRLHHSDKKSGSKGAKQA